MRRIVWVVVDDHGSRRTSVDGLPAPDRVVAADSGLHLAQRLGIDVDVDVVVGDLDSVDSDALAAAEAAGAGVRQHPTAKDATDLALALHVAVDGDVDVVVVGGSGGRLDHALANLHALADPDLRPARVRGRLGGADLWVVHDAAELDLPVGATVSLLPLGGPARGITTSGLRYELDDGELAAYGTRGVSNVVERQPARVELTSGCLVAIHDEDDDR